MTTMLTPFLRRAKETSGAALAELALVIPLLLLILLGMLDLGKAFNEWIDQTHLANEGARLAAVGYPAVVTGCDGSTATNPNTCLAQYIQERADIQELKSGRTGNAYASAQDPAQVCISYPTNPSSNTHGLVGDPVEVTVRTTYHWLNYLVNQADFGDTPIEGKATMRLERAADADAAGTTTCYPTS
jgi:Flp pilus assembly protein TadG